MVQSSVESASYNTEAVVVIAVLLAWIWIWRVLEWVWLGPRRLERRLRQQGIGGHPYRLFHGDMKDMRRMRSEAVAAPMPQFSHHYFPRIRPFLHRTFINHGKVSVTWEGPVATVNVGEADLMKEVLSNPSDFFKLNSNPLTAMLVRGLVTYDARKWALHRNLINPAFRIHKLKLMLPAFYTSCRETLRSWENKVSNAEHEIDVCGGLVSLSADSISRAAFGSSFEEGRLIFQLIRDQIFVTVNITHSVYFPGRRYLPTEDNKKIKAIEREIRALLGGIIHKRKKAKEARDDLLGILLDSNSQNDDDQRCSTKNKDRQQMRITSEELIDECKLFYLAGQDTTSTLLTWTMILLAKHQDWQARARDQVLHVCGTNNPDFEDLNHLKIVNMILHEVLRLYPPVLETKRRVVKDNTRLGSLVLPKGTTINLPIIYLHHDPQVWGHDAKEFNPDRFSQGTSKGSASFMAFGWGPRICVGTNFAIMQAKIAVSMILQRFAFQLSPSYVHAPKADGILYPQFGAPITFHTV